MGTAARAGVGLSVKTPIGRVFVLATASVTHGETLHRRPRAVIGQTFDDAVAWAAIGAVCEGIMETSIIRVENFTQAVGTCRQVGQDHGRLRASGAAVAHLEAGVAREWKEGGYDAVKHAGARLLVR